MGGGILYSMIGFVSKRLGLNCEEVGQRPDFIARGKAGH